MDEATVLKKVKKLLNMADSDRNSAIPECETALAMAHKLLRKHHLSMSRVLELDDGIGSGTDFMELREEEAAAFKANTIPKWMIHVIMTVNRISQTKTLIKRTPREDSVYSDLRIVFVGDNLDVLSATELFNYLRTTTSKLASAHKKEIKGNFRHWRSFAEGCTNTLLERARLLDSKVDKEINRIFGSSSADDFDVSNFELDEDEDDYEIIDDDVFEETLKSEKALVLYGQYKHSKFQKISEYLEEKAVEEEKCSSKTARTISESFEMGTEAGEEIPLAVSKKLTK